MDSSIIIFGLAIIIAISAAALAITGFYKKSLLTSHKLQYFSVFLSVLAVSIALYDKVANPELPEVLAVCSEYSEFPPTKITCFEKSNNAKKLKWSFEDGSVIENESEVSREFTIPGDYQITLMGSGTGLAYSRTAESVVNISIKEKPVEKKVVEKSHRFSESNTSGGKTTKRFTFKAENGFKIIDSRLNISSKRNASAKIVSKSDSTVTISITLDSKPVIKGLQFRLDKAYISGNIVLIQKEK